MPSEDPLKTYRPKCDFLCISQSPGGEREARGKPIVLTAEQREVVDRAIAAAREEHEEETLGEGECVRLICKSYLERE